MQPSGFENWIDDLRDWFAGLSHTQVGVIGGVIGYLIAVVAGPILRLSLTILVLVIFGLISRSISSRFESRLGMTGVVVAILTVSSLGGVQSVLGDLVGDILMFSSRFALALLGAHFAFYLHTASIGPQGSGET